MEEIEKKSCIHNEESVKQTEDNELEEISKSLSEFLDDLIRAYDQQVDKEYAGKFLALRKDGVLDVRLDTPTHLSIHLGAWKTDAKDRIRASYENYQRLANDFRELAYQLVHARAYRNVEDILAFSWLVTKHLNAFQTLGFHIKEKGIHPLENILCEEYERANIQESIPYKDIQPSLAVMSKEEFIAKYYKAASDEAEHNL